MSRNFTNAWTDRPRESVNLFRGMPLVQTGLGLFQGVRAGNPDGRRSVFALDGAGGHRIDCAHFVND